MAGEGSRFQGAGFNIPKPYIILKEIPLFVRATESVLKSSNKEFNLIFVIQKNHENKFQVKKLIRSFYPDSQIVEVPNLTGGALESALFGIKAIKNEFPILINDSDHAFVAQSIDTYIELLENNEIQGFLAHFESDSNNYSYAQYDNNANLEMTAEKKVISKMAIAGIYGLSAKTYVEQISEKYLKENKYAESFISGLYNEIVQSGGVVKGFKLDDHTAFGTPEEFYEAEKKLLNE